MTFSEVTDKIRTDDTVIGLSSIHINNEPDYVRLTLFEYDKPSEKYRYLYSLRSYGSNHPDVLVGEMYSSFRNIEDITHTLICNYESIHDFTTVPKADSVLDKISRINGIMRSSMLSIANKYLKSAYLHKLRYANRYYISKSFGDYPPSICRTGNIDDHNSIMGASTLDMRYLNFNYGLEGMFEYGMNIVGESNKDKTILIPSKFNGNNECIEIDEEIYNRFRQLQQTCITSIHDILTKYFDTNK